MLLSPEERELQTKTAELASLESELAERELELATLRAELRAFETRYLSIVGAKFAERDALEAQVADIRARRYPAASYVHQRAADARRKADESATAVNAALGLATDGEFKPSEQLKGLYRAIARRVHPDLSVDEGGRNRRTQVMAEANLAYAEGDERRLRLLLEEWESSPDSVEGEGVAADLVRTIRKIHQAKQRLQRIGAEILEVRDSDLYRLRSEVESAKVHGRDLLAEMAQQLDAENARLRVLLQSLLSVEVSS